MKPLGTQVLAEFFNCSKDILNDKEAIEKALCEGIERYDLGLIGINSHCYEPLGLTSIAVISESHVAVHTYPEARHASLDIYTCSRDTSKSMALLTYLKTILGPGKTRVAEMTRGIPIDIKTSDWVLDNSDADGFDIRYHIKNPVFHSVSAYQDITIIDNVNFGRMLFLDNELQIAESDAHLYNASMVFPLIESGCPLTDIAILGGGDGGVLHELLTHNPGTVTLIDIDKEVVDAARRYLPGICRTAFDDDRVTVVHDDVFTFLDGDHRFDAIIYDLTMHPEAFIVMERESYLRQLFTKIRDSLRPGGCVTFQCCSEFDRETYSLIDRLLSDIFSSLSFKSTYIPSFCAVWNFATVFTEAD